MLHDPNLFEPFIDKVITVLLFVASNAEIVVINFRPLQPPLKSRLKNQVSVYTMLAIEDNFRYKPTVAILPSKHSVSHGSHIFEESFDGRRICCTVWEQLLLERVVELV